MARSTSSPVVMPDASIPGVSGRRVALNLLIAIRPGQWSKNLLVFAGLLFGMRLFEASAVLRALAAFGIFCGLSSAVYLGNDIVDRDSDRRHPLKAMRPIASGALPVSIALAAAATIGAVTIAAAAGLGWRFATVAVGYLALQALYSGPLKQIVIIDVLTLSGGFVLRAVAGAVAIDVEIGRSYPAPQHRRSKRSRNAVTRSCCSRTMRPVTVGSSASTAPICSIR